MRSNLTLVLAAVMLGGLAAGCRGTTSEEPPIVPLRNMYETVRYDPHGRSTFFDDHRTMRPLVEGTVAREMPVDISLQTGRNADNDQWVSTIPDSVLGKLGGMDAAVARGEERFGVYCAGCHGLSGDGLGMVARRAAFLNAAALQPPSYHSERIRQMPDGQMFATISNGIRNMPPQKHSVPVDDRWAIITWVRALQISQSSLPLDARGCQDTFNELLELGNIEFETGSARVSGDSEHILERLIDTAKRCPEADFEVDGHTDNVGDPAANQTLSEQRAQAVAAKMRRAGITRSRVTTRGFGQTRPIESNDTPEGRARNRRIQFVVQGVDAAEGE